MKEETIAPITVGFIGQGYIGKNLADNFESRRIPVIRYSEEKEYVGNKDLIKDCDIVFVAVPTPTIDSKFDGSILEEVIALTKPGAMVVIKSTIVPDFARELAAIYPDRFIMVNPEFLNEVTARYDTDNPVRNIIGVPDVDDADWKIRARTVMDLLPKANIGMVCTYEEASLIKYAGNCFLYTKIIFFNLLHDLAKDYKADWNTVVNAVTADPRIGPAYTEIKHKSGRGAGGHCLVKDFVAFRKLYFMRVGSDDVDGCSLLINNEMKNKKLLKNSNKDLDILREVYGKGS